MYGNMLTRIRSPQNMNEELVVVNICDSLQKIKMKIPLSAPDSVYSTGFTGVPETLSSSISSGVPARSLAAGGLPAYSRSAPGSSFAATGVGAVDEFRSRRTYPAAPCVCYQAKEKEPLGDVLKRAGKRALGGGLPGASAMAIQVLSLMWMRTTVNYQYRYGGTMKETFRTLYSQGGIPRFYKGLLPALFQGPLSRFGDTAANSGTLALLDSYDSTSDLPVAVKTLAASACSAGFRIFLMPIDALKTTMQVEGSKGLPNLRNKIAVSGPTVLWHGSLGAMSANFVGHYPWFFTYNTLNEALPKYEDDLPKRLLRSALIGFSASFVSDTSSNSLRVIKTTKQTSAEAVTYPQVVRNIIAKDGLVNGLLIRGLGTKILANGAQGMMFTVLWRLGQDFYNKKE